MIQRNTIEPATLSEFLNSKFLQACKVKKKIADFIT